jgi:hypothetical protein
LGGQRNIEWEGEGGFTPQVGTAIRAEVQFFALVSEAGGAVMICAVESAVLERRKFVGKNFMMKNLVQFFFSNTTLFSNGRTGSGKEGTRAP